MTAREAATAHAPDARRHPGAATPTAYAVVLGLVALLAALLVTVAAPGAARAAEGAPPGGAWVRVGHFVPGMSQANVVLEPAEPGAASTPMGEIDYGTISGYQKLAPGSYTATVSGSTDESDGTSEPLLSSTFEVAAGDSRTVAVVGTADQPRLTLLTDDLTVPEPGTSRVRLLSASEQMGSIDVRALKGPIVADDAVLGEVTPYATVPTGSWTLVVSSEGAEATRQQVSIDSGSVYTVVLLDAPDGGVELDVVTDAAGAAVAPKGGAETGGGGTAVTVAGPVSPGSPGDLQIGAGALAALAALVVAATGGIGAIRMAGRRRGVVPARH